MKKITLKIIDTIAKNHNSDVIEVFSVFLANIAAGNIDFENVASKIFDLQKVENREILEDFFEYLKEDVIKEKDEFAKNLSSFATDFQKEATALASFFVIFLPQDVIFSKDALKIKQSLQNYPDEIRDTIIKALEFLSMLLVKDLEKKVKQDILKNILEMMIILKEVVKLIGK